MKTFLPVDDHLLADRIGGAISRLIFVAPAVSNAVGKALIARFPEAGRLATTIVLDPDEEPYRLGYGDLDGLSNLQKAARNHHITLRSQPGLRVGVLIADDAVLVWSPTPKSVEAARGAGEPNGVDLCAALPAAAAAAPSNEPSEDLFATAQAESLASVFANGLRNVIAADDSEVLITDAEIGREPFTPERVTATVAALQANPPAPFDLAQKTRVFSTRYQFVDWQLRGAAWTDRQIKLSSLLINPDLTPELQELFETRVRPFSHQADVAVDVPVMVHGRLAYEHDGRPMLASIKQAQIKKDGDELRDKYLTMLDGFGWMIERSRKEAFEKEVKAYESVLQSWVDGFAAIAFEDEEALVGRIVDMALERATRAPASARLRRPEIYAAVQKGLERLKITKAGVKRVFKDIAWESTRDEEFTDALLKAFPSARKEPWFQVFIAACGRPAT